MTATILAEKVSELARMHKAVVGQFENIPFLKPLTHRRYPLEVRPKEKKRMTIGIGVLCSMEGKRPDALVMIADSMGSTETDSTNALSKMFTRGSIHAVGAGSLTVAAEMFSSIADQLDQLQDNRTHGSMWKTLNLAVNGIRSEKFFWEVLRNEHVIENEVMGRIFVDDQASIQAAWKNYYIGADLLLGTFDSAGQALLYYIGRYLDTPGLVHLVQFPGHHSIGTGSQNASAWLNFRSQALNFGVKRSLYHAYEASRMAASAPTVNKEIEITIATNGESSYFAKERFYPGKFSISFTELEDMYRKHGPQNTDGIKFEASTLEGLGCPRAGQPPQPP